MFKQWVDHSDEQIHEFDLLTYGFASSISSNSQPLRNDLHVACWPRVIRLVLELACQHKRQNRCKSHRINRKIILTDICFTLSRNPNAPQPDKPCQPSQPYKIILENPLSLALTLLQRQEFIRKNRHQEQISSSWFNICVQHIVEFWWLSRHSIT